MKLVLATNHLGLGGSESYLLTVAEQLDRLGHEVVIYTGERGSGVDVARERALQAGSEAILPDHCDALLVQDSAVSYELAARYPEAPQVFVAHSEYFDLQLPPQVNGIVSTIVALNDRIARQVRALGVEVEVVRLRQPIDIKRFAPGTALRERPHRALVLSNAIFDKQYAALEAAWGEETGIELLRVGGSKGQSVDPRPAIWSADFVVGYGRSVLEGMACGRAAYVYDHDGGDGWVTAASYPALESDGFGGAATSDVIDSRRLREDLHRFDPEMGTVNRDLIATHHRTNWHAQELVQLLRAAAPPRHARRTPLDEMARLVRLERRASAEVRRIARERMRQRKLAGELREHLTGKAQEVERLRDEIRQLRAERRRVAQIRRDYESTLSWRVTRPLRAIRRLFKREGL